MSGAWVLLDPTGPRAGVALARGEGVLAAAVFPSRRFVGFLGTGLAGLFEAAGVEPPAAGVAVAVGPGSIMGGRAAVAWARGAATGGVPLRGVGSLEVVRRAAGPAEARPVWAVGEAVRGEAYLAVDGAPPERMPVAEAVATARKEGPVWAGWVPPALAADPGTAEARAVDLPCFEAMWEVARAAEDVAPDALSPLVLYPPPIQ